MRLRSIEPTPNPNNMKLNLEESLPQGERYAYSTAAPAAERAHYPVAIRGLLDIPGVKSLYHCLDFVAVQRVSSSADWQGILARARDVLGDPGTDTPAPTEESGADDMGQVHMFIQYFRRIPLLVKAQKHTLSQPHDDQREGSDTQAGGADEGLGGVTGAAKTVEEVRANLPPRFAAAVKAATPASPNMLLDRRWVLVEPRYGELQEAAEALAAEIDASYPDARLEALVHQAFVQSPDGPEVKETRRRYTDEERAELLASGDWKQRYAAVDSLGADAAHFNELAAAMQDPHISVRRLATIYLGLLKIPETLEPLIGALKDKAPVIRRTAGDALNDLAPSGEDRDRAIEAMVEALGDKNKLVRWRAARFLYELGDASALAALKTAAADAPEFEVRLQAAQAVERIEGGRPAAGPIWMQMTRKSE